MVSQNLVYLVRTVKVVSAATKNHLASIEYP